MGDIDLLGGAGQGADVTTEVQTERYYRVARLEIQRGDFREPTWDKALVEADGDEKAAEDLYLEWRVSQMAEDETRRKAAVETLDDARRSNDEIAPRFVQKTMLLGSVTILVLGLAVYWLVHR